MSVYVWTMRSASVILFVLALLIVVGTIGFNLLAWHSIAADPSYQQTLQASQWAQVLISLVNSLQNAALPLLGAAALWRADRWLGGKRRAAGGME